MPNTTIEGVSSGIAHLVELCYFSCPSLTQAVRTKCSNERLHAHIFSDLNERVSIFFLKIPVTAEMTHIKHTFSSEFFMVCFPIIQTELQRIG